MEYRFTSSLKSHPENNKIYHDTFKDDKFLEMLADMQENGFAESTPVEITKDNVIISGHRRVEAALRIRLDSIPVFVSSLIDETDILNRLLSSNSARKLSGEAEIRHDMKRAEVLTILGKRKMSEAAKKQINRANRYAKKEILEGGVESPPPSTKKKREPRTLDVIAKERGTTRKTLKKKFDIVKQADSLAEKGDIEQSQKILDALNTKSVTAAYKMAEPAIQENRAKKQQEQIAKKEAEKKKEIPTAPLLSIQELKVESQVPVKKTYFNQPSDSIEWAKWSWNPVTGCLHGCKYCYARDIALRFKNSFPKGFEPDFREERLNAPECTKIPKAMMGMPGSQNVFVCSMADLFGKWVSQEWIDKVFAACNDNPQWNYLFLTKNPNRYLTLDFPKTAWVGATGDTQVRMDRALRVFYDLKESGKKPPVTFISAEPLNEEIIMNETHLNALDWLIIGGQSKSSNEPAKQPDWLWVEKMLFAARKAGVKVYFKPNLTVMPKEFPS